METCIICQLILIDFIEKIRFELGTEGRVVMRDGRRAFRVKGHQKGHSMLSVYYITFSYLHIQKKRAIDHGNLFHFHFWLLLLANNTDIFFKWSQLNLISGGEWKLSKNFCEDERYPALNHSLRFCERELSFLYFSKHLICRVNQSCTNQMEGCK